MRLVLWTIGAWMVLALAAAVSAAAASKPARTALGPVRALVSLGTWGPAPFAREEVDRVVLGDSAAWLAQSSFGKLTLSGETTPWLRVPQPDSCDRDLVSQDFQAAATRAGYAPATYDRIVYAVPALGCPYTGFASGREAFLMNALSRTLVVHELGHTFGLRHAKTIECDSGACVVHEYGDRYDTMGSGDGDFNAFEKFQLGWLTEIARAHADGVYGFEAIERRSALPQAFVIETATNEYWLDHREPEWDDPRFRSALPPDNVFVHAGPPTSNPIAATRYPEGNVLVSPPAGNRQVFLTGDRLAEAGAFEAVVVGRVGPGMQVRFRWTDRTAPGRPSLVTPGRTVRVRGGLHVTWTPGRELGSGIERYELRLDGAAPLTIRPDFRVGEQADVLRPARGRHTLTLVAVDRAGNRSAPAVRRILVR
jgi:hypothetical protein